MKMKKMGMAVVGSLCALCALGTVSAAGITNANVIAELKKLKLKARTDKDNPIDYKVGEDIRFDFCLDGVKTLPTEKIRILRERGLFKEELAKVSARYNVRTAVTNICDFVAIRKATLEVVNFTKRHSENAKE